VGIIRLSHGTAEAVDFVKALVKTLFPVDMIARDG
jgi:hypothetical protein